MGFFIGLYLSVPLLEQTYENTLEKIGLFLSISFITLLVYLFYEDHKKLIFKIWNFMLMTLLLNNIYF